MDEELDITPYKIGDTVKVDWSEEVFTIAGFGVDGKGYDEFLIYLEGGTYLRPSEVTGIVTE